MDWPKHAYAREKFMVAANKLATGEGDVRSRLRSAYRTLRILNLEDLPEEMWDDWRWIKHQMTKFGPLRHEDGEVWRGSVDNTMSRIRNRTGSEIAKRIYQMHGSLIWRQHNRPHG
jgi:hypothetical protein